MVYIANNETLPCDMFDIRESSKKYYVGYAGNVFIINIVGKTSTRVAKRTLSNATQARQFYVQVGREILSLVTALPMQNVCRMVVEKYAMMLVPPGEHFTPVMMSRIVVRRSRFRQRKRLRRETILIYT